MNLEHKKRWIAGAIGVGAIFGAYYLYEFYAVVGITILLSLVAYYEFLVFSGQKKESLIVALIVGALLAYRLNTSSQMAMLYVTMAFLALQAHGLFLVHQSNGESTREEFLALAMRSFGLVYLICFPAFVPYIYAGGPQGPALLLLLLLTIWTTDIAAYYGGKWFGVKKLSPNISPGKTLAGSITGLGACAAMCVAFRFGVVPEMPLGKILLLVVLTSMASQAGDLLESLMKRAYNVKDSGTLLPGHGGVFDRFDSLIFAAPFFYFLLVLLAQ